VDIAYDAYIYRWVSLYIPDTRLVNLTVYRCEAINQDRETVKQLLTELYMVLHIRNILRALEVLEKHWKGPDDSYTDVADFLPF
jgi:hypothetical protein